MKRRNIIPVLAGMLFSLTFGIIDNAGLLFGMDFNPMLRPSQDPLLSGMWGNTFSDMVGAFVGVVVYRAFLWAFHTKPKEFVLSQAIGVTIGCIVPILLYLLIR